VCVVVVCVGQVVGRVCVWYVRPVLRVVGGGKV